MRNSKLLIITYYWPPAGGPGVQRWLKFVKYLPDFNIQPIVYVPENPTYPIIDTNLEKEVSNNLLVLKQPIFEPYQLAGFLSKKSTEKISSGIIPPKKKQNILQKVMLWVRGNFFIPDARVYWVKPSVKYLKKYIEEHGIETIITSGPPHSLHLIGLHLKNSLPIHWIADFRDPWTTIGYHRALKLSKYAQHKHKKLEKQVMQTADTLLVTSPTTKKEFESITTKPIEVITNGYDIENVEKKPLDTKFSLAHIGSFLSARNPEILWQSLSELCVEHRDFATHLELKLIGAISAEVLQSIEKYNLSSYVNNLGYVSHKIAVEAQRSSQVLLLIEINSEETKSIIPGKLFEYMVSERPILAIGPKDSDFETILKQTNTGTFFLYHEKEALKAQIKKYYASYLEQNLKVSPVGLQYFSRKKLTEKLVEVIQKFNY